MARKKTPKTPKRSPLDVALEKLLKTAEKRVNKIGAALEKQIKKRVDKAVKAAETTIGRVAKRATNELGQQLQSAIRALARNADEVARQLDLNPEQTSRLRRGLDTTSGAVTGFKAAAPWAALVPDPRLRAAILAAGAVVGATQGAAQEEIRKELAKAMAEIEREKLELRDVMAAVNRDVERVQARRRATGVVG